MSSLHPVPSTSRSAGRSFQYSIFDVNTFKYLIYLMIGATAAKRVKPMVIVLPLILVVGFVYLVIFSARFSSPLFAASTVEIPRINNSTGASAPSSNALSSSSPSRSSIGPSSSAFCPRLVALFARVSRIHTILILLVL